MTNLGRQTLKKIQAKFGIGPSTRELLQLEGGPRRGELLAMIDAGQRGRVAAQLVALRLDLLPAG